MQRPSDKQDRTDWSYLQLATYDTLGSEIGTILGPLTLTLRSMLHFLPPRFMPEPQEGWK